MCRKSLICVKSMAISRLYTQSPIVHFLTSLIFVVVLYPFYGYWSLAVFIGGFFIDFDHYLWWIMKKRNFNPFKCYRELKKENKEIREKFKDVERPVYLKDDMLHIFHVWEFWALILLLTFIHKFFFVIFLGVVIHIGLDFIDLFMNRIYGKRAVSFFGWLRRHKKNLLMNSL